MAILRGGKRIGGFDIRVGIPRDRSLENVENDPRFRQRAGGNPETTIGRFQGMVNEAEGFARKARFYVEFNLPTGRPTIVAGDPNSQPSQASLESQLLFRDQAEHQSIQKANARRVQAFCSAIDMPNRDVQLKEVRTHGPAHKIAFDHKSNDITATFYTDKFLRERSYFEAWQESAFSLTSHNYNFYDNYVSDVNIYQLGQFASRNERDDITYAVQLFNCYPKEIGPVSYSHEANNLQTFEVTFSHRYWINYFLDRQGNIELGQSDFRDVTVKSKYGALGGLLNKLPPELRRAGRDVLEGLKRRIPIGGVTGGRVFPPFGNFPPLNI